MVTGRAAALAADQAGHFQERCQTWTARYRTNPSFRARLVVVGRALESALTGIPGARVLDFGGGTGVFSVLAAQRAHFVLCVDRSEAMLRAGSVQRGAIQDLLAEAGFTSGVGRVHCLVGDEEAIVAARGSFDVVLAVALLEYVDDTDQVTLSLARGLRPGALLLLTVPNAASPLRVAQRLASPLIARAGRRSARLADQAFVAMRPHGDHVPWRHAAALGGLLVEAVTPVPLGARGLGRLFHPNLLVSLRSHRRRQ